MTTEGQDINLTKKEKADLLEKILRNEKRIVAFYSYPTGGHGSENEIASTSRDYGDECNHWLRNFIEITIQLGASLAGQSRNDNKNAVELEIEDINFPIFFYQYDGTCYITSAIRSNAGATKTKINWNISG